MLLFFLPFEAEACHLGISIHIGCFGQSFVCDGQGAVRQATLHWERSRGKGEQLLISYLFPWKTKSFQKGSTLKGKNLLLEEQILSFKS